VSVFKYSNYLEIFRTKSIVSGKRALGSPRQRREDNIRMDPKEIDINKSNWVDLAQDRNWSSLVNVVVNL